MASPNNNEDVLIGKMLDEDAEIENGILDTLRDARELGKVTLFELQSQGKQLGGAQYGMDEILFQQNESQKKVNIIKSFLWDIAYKIAPCLKKRSDFDNHVKRDPMKKGSTGKIHDAMGGDIIADSLKPGENLDKYLDSDKRLDEMEALLDDLGDLAVKMGDELNHHDKQIEVLGKTTGQAQDNDDILSGQIGMMLR